MLPPQGTPNVLVSYTGITTLDGAGDGSTVICSGLALEADFDGNQINILSGTYKGQARDINGTTTLGTVTVANNFGGQILEGTAFVIVGIRTHANLENIEVEVGVPTAAALNEIAVTGEQLTTECTVTLSLPTDAVIQKASVIALITAMNNTANTQKIDVAVQARKGAGAWGSYYSQDDCLGLPNSDAITTNLIAISDITDLVTATGAYGFRCSINQSAANSVRYTTQYVLIVVYV